MDIVGDAITAVRSGQPASDRARLRPPWGLRFSPFEGAGFHVILQGSAWLLPPGGAGPIALRAGDVAFVWHGKGHALADDPASALADVSSDPADSWWSDDVDDGPGEPPTVLLCGSYHLDRARPHPLIAALPDVIHLPGGIGANAAVSSVVDLLGAELESQRPGASAAVPALLDLLLLYIVRTWYHQQAGEAADGWAAALSDTGITTALHHIQHDPELAWTVDSLAARAGMSRAAFARRFAALVGQPPLGYLTWWRMTLASRLLRETTSPLATIAERIGYSSDYAFSKAFKKEFGVAPGVLRRQQRIAPAEPKGGIRSSV